MTFRKAHCVVVEVPAADDSAMPESPSFPRDLLPWADPYIARLLAKHRLQAALDDSLEFLAADASGRRLPANRLVPKRGLNF